MKVKNETLFFSKIIVKRDLPEWLTTCQYRDPKIRRKRQFQNRDKVRTETIMDHQRVTQLNVKCQCFEQFLLVSLVNDIRLRKTIHLRKLSNSMDRTS